MLLLASPADIPNTSPTGSHLLCTRTHIPEMRLNINNTPRRDTNDSPANGGRRSIFISAWRLVLA